MLFRFLFSPSESWYANGMDFSDINSNTSDHWAVYYLTRAWQLEWISGYPDNTLRPDDPITLAEAVTIINTALDRNEAFTSVKNDSSPFADLSETHWAYSNILEAAGELVYDQYGIPDQSARNLPQDATDAYYYVSDTEGWVVRTGSGINEIVYTSDGGKSWDVVCNISGGDLPNLEVSSIFFFDSQNGIISVSIESSPFNIYTIYTTSDGGKSWSDFFDTEENKLKYLPFSRMAGDSSSSLDSIYEQFVSSVSIQPINKDAVYINIKYTERQLEVQKKTVYSLSD